MLFNFCLFSVDFLQWRLQTSKSASVKLSLWRKADFIDADQALATTGTRTLEEIAASTSSTTQAEPEVQPPLPITRQQAYQAFDQLRRYIEENATDPKAIQHCHYFEDFFHQEQAKVSVQAPITQFFH